jgi:hypothetical protein
MDVTPNIVRRNAHRTDDSFYIEPWRSASCLMRTTHVLERLSASVAQYNVETCL